MTRNQAAATIRELVASTTSADETQGVEKLLEAIAVRDDRGELFSALVEYGARSAWRTVHR
jgi:hypothetical protein